MCPILGSAPMNVWLTDTGHVPRASMPAFWSAQETPSGEKNTSGHVVLWSRWLHTKQVHVLMCLWGGCKVWPPGRHPWSPPEVCRNVFRYRMTFCSQAINYCPPSARFNIGAAKEISRMHQTTSSTKFLKIEWTRKTDGEHQRLPFPVPGESNDVWDSPCRTQVHKLAPRWAASQVFLQTEFHHSVNQHGSLSEARKSKTRPGCLHFQRGGATPEEFRAAHSAPECSHLVNPMLGPVRVHSLGLLKHFSWGIWEDVWKHCGKMKKSQLGKDQWKWHHPPFFSVPCTKKESVYVEGGKEGNRKACIGLGTWGGVLALLSSDWEHRPSARLEPMGPAANLG